MEEAHNQEVQKRKQLELRQEEERRRREEELRAHTEDLLRRQQGQGGNFAEKVSFILASTHTDPMGTPPRFIIIINNLRQPGLNRILYLCCFGYC